MNNKNLGFTPNIEGMEKYLTENSSQDFDGPIWWNIPQGMSSVRILPPWDPTGRVALTVYSHPIEFQGSGMRYKKYNWTCVNRTFGKTCNICEGLDKLAAAGVNISDYEPTRRTFYLNAIVMYDPIYDKDIKSGKKPEACDGVAPGTHVLMKAPKTIYDWIVSNITNPMVGDITSLENGIDVYITKEGSGLGTTYTATLSPDGRKPVPQEYLDKIDSLYNLDEIFATGFDQDQVNELVESLGRSSNIIGATVNNVMNTMSGIQNQQVQPQAYSQQTQFTNVQPSVTAPVPPSPFNQPSMAPYNPIQTPNNQSQPTVPPWQEGVPVSTVQPQQNPVSDKPKCFGQYTPSSVQCVTCSHEIPCSQSK